MIMQNAGCTSTTLALILLRVCLMQLGPTVGFGPSTARVGSAAAAAATATATATTAATTAAKSATSAADVVDFWTFSIHTSTFNTSSWWICKRKDWTTSFNSALCDESPLTA